MKKIFLFPLILLGSAAATGGVYFIYKASKNTTNTPGISIKKSEELPKTKDLKDNVVVNPSDKKSIRIGFWNVYNYSNKSTRAKNTAKTYAIAKVIDFTGLDLIGLAEIKPNADGADLVKELQNLNPNAGWKELTTNKYGKKNQEEKYTFLYKSSLLETINFENPSNPYLIQDGTELTWARPLAAVKFKTKTTIKNDFTLAIGHFDAPNASKNRNEAKDSETSQGAQEAGEARDLVNVLGEIDKKDGENNEIIFMADTNIRGENAEKLFKSTLKSYKSLLSHNENTTLSGSRRSYANSYDKIFYKGDLATKNAQKFDIFSIFSNKIVDLAKYDQMRRKDGRSANYQANNPNDLNRIRAISDHTMVHFDLELNESDKN
ncbi:Membrane nuclease MnuA [Mesomycoplasma dispar]|uniref:Membrane nuclease MnuA n=1 Tax=Mesomycoplasma dispar TaxID=86660 RepID=A0AAJ5NLN6_9BACT|nr:endonuclease/exonuclease/phosphatase family protein [Mesomycoplasma dispar]AJR12324.1 nuclease [Mesomycoplasma dispar]VEU62141.1 Membrane nuclease MnuA [Mesomycoplasma dispar]